MKYMLFFGSLRKNSKRGYNFNRFGGQTYLKDYTLNGFKMYSINDWYPAVCREKGKIKCELHSVEDGAAKNIEGMEIGAGYTGIEIPIVHEDKEITATIYTWPKEKLKQYKKIESGDWD